MSIPLHSTVSVLTAKWLHTMSDSAYRGFLLILKEEIVKVFAVPRLDVSCNDDVKKGLLSTYDNLERVDRSILADCKYISYIIKLARKKLYKCSKYNTTKRNYVAPFMASIHLYNGYETDSMVNDLLYKQGRSPIKSHAIQVPKVTVPVIESNFGEQTAYAFPSLESYLKTNYGLLLSAKKLDLNVEETYLINQISDSYVPNLKQNASALVGASAETRQKAEKEFARQLTYMNSEIERIKNDHHNRTLDDVHAQTMFFVSQSSLTTSDNMLSLATIGNKR
jgi:hypothetical protein